MRTLLSIAAILLLSVTGFAQNSKTEPTTIKGVNWNLAYIPNHVPEKTNKQVNLFVSDTTDRMGGSAGCNSYGGQYTIKGKKIKFEQVISTMMACASGMGTEKKLLAVFESADKYDIKNGQLRLKKGGKVLAVFNAAN